MELRVKMADGAALREAREAADLTQVELAARLGVSPRTIQYWEASDEIEPKRKHRHALAAFLLEAEDGAAA